MTAPMMSEHGVSSREKKQSQKPADFGYRLSLQSKLALHFAPRDAGLAGVTFDRGVEVAQVLQIFDPSAKSFQLGVKLADGDAVRLALSGGSILTLLFDASQHTRRWLRLPDGTECGKFRRGGGCPGQNGHGKAQPFRTAGGGAAGQPPLH